MKTPSRRRRATGTEDDQPTTDSSPSKPAAGPTSALASDSERRSAKASDTALASDSERRSAKASDTALASDSERRSVRPAATAGFPMSERSALATVLGLPPIAAFGLAAGGTVLGVLADILRIGTVGSVFTALYFVGCVLAITWVRRRSLFAAMVQPPLLLAVAVPVVVLLAAPPRPGSGITEQLIAVGAPLVNAFPTMATTTAVVLAGGGLRILLQPLDPTARGLIPALRERVAARGKSAAARSST